MVSRRISDPDQPVSRHRPATTPEGREQQLISMAVDAVEKRIRDGTASAQELVHYLKLGSTREKLEQERLTRENQLLAAKTDAIASASRMEELVGEAIEAMRSYRSSAPDEYDG